MIDYTLTEEEKADLRERGALMNGPESVRYIVVHCSATPVTADYTVEQMAKDHKLRGFRTIGYHFYIRKDGTMTQHRKLLEVGAHCKPFNRCSIGVCYEGGIGPQGNPSDTRTEAQKARMRDLIQEMKTVFPKAVVRGHREMPGATPKACPCFDASKWYREL
jgi:N-acetyl-anhydromuramyl-L-alanine amidase AmpD